MPADGSTVIAVIGLGSIGLRHARNFLAAGVTVRGFDPDPARRALLSNNGGVACATREAALERANAVVIASPPKLHRGDMQSAVDAGCHVFIEKPLAPAADGMRALLDAAHKKNLLVFAGLNLRLHPAVQAARSRISGGVIGRPRWARLIMASYLPDWRPQQDYRRGYAADPASGGIVLDLIHEVDLARYLLGPLTLAGAFASHTGTIELSTADMADILLRDGNGAHVNIHLDYVTRPRRRRTEIAGDNGLIEIDLDARRMTRLDLDGNCAETQSFNGSYSDDYVAESKLFLDCIAGRARPLCDGYEAIDVLELAIAARNAAETYPA
jgi:predicted dehydrogenase